jgi:hypothetical protein
MNTTFQNVQSHQQYQHGGDAYFLLHENGINITEYGGLELSMEI